MPDYFLSNTVQHNIQLCACIKHNPPPTPKKKV